MNESLLYGTLAILDCNAASWARGAGHVEAAEALVARASNFLALRGRCLHAHNLGLREVLQRKL